MEFEEAVGHRSPAGLRHCLARSKDVQAVRSK